MAGFALVNYNVAAAAAGATNTDLTAANDPDFTARSGHYTLTEPYRLGGVLPVGASVIRGRFQMPTWNALGEWIIFNANRSLQPPSNPQFDLYLAAPPPLPMNEEIQVQLSNNLGAATEIENCGLLLLTKDWTPQRPAAIATMIVRATFTVTPTLNVWSGGQTIALSASLRNGVYAVVGATCQGTNAAFFRIIFPKYRLYLGRKLRPGLPVQTAVGDVLNNQINPWQLALGEWGRFHTFELPQVEVFGTAAVGTTYQVFLWLAYLGEDQSLLNAGLGGGPIFSGQSAGFGIQMAM
jgi:hypothetical protein